MRITNKIKEKCINAIIEFMKTNEASTKNAIIDGALLLYGLDKKDVNGTAPRSKGNLTRSYLATAFNDLLTKNNTHPWKRNYKIQRSKLDKI